MMFNGLLQASRCWGNRVCSHNALKKEELKLKRNLPENFQLSVKGMSLVQADGNSWKGRAKHITSLLYITKHVRSPDGQGTTACRLLIRNGKCLEIK